LAGLSKPIVFGYDGCGLAAHDVEGAMADYDSPWKEALDVYFKAFLAFFFPEIHRDINWSRGFESLDKELQQIAPQSAHGRRYVDKLVKVWLNNGRAVCVLIHVEVQTQRQRGFERRMYIYNNRIKDHYNRTVVSLVVLADDDPRWRPNTYREALWGWSVTMTFPPVKLLDYANRVAELEADSNPFARVVLAHLKALETQRDPATRRTWKFRLVRGLYERGFQADDVRQLFRLIDWLMELPPTLDNMFWQDVKHYEEERSMPFVTTPERMGMKTGMLQLIEDLLRSKFDEEGLSLMADLGAIHEANKLRTLFNNILKATSAAEARQMCAAATAPTEPPKKSGRRKRE
jgi:hypothetical protein